MSFIKKMSMSLLTKTAPGVAKSVLSPGNELYESFSGKLDNAKEEFLKAKRELVATGEAFEGIGPVSRKFKSQLRSGSFGLSSEEKDNISFGTDDLGDMDFDDMGFGDETTSSSDYSEETDTETGITEAYNTNNTTNNKIFNITNGGGDGVTQGDALINERLTINTRLSTNAANRSIGIMSAQVTVLREIHGFLTDNTAAHYSASLESAQLSANFMSSMETLIEPTKLVMEKKVEEYKRRSDSAESERDGFNLNDVMDPSRLFKKLKDATMFDMVFGEMSPLREFFKTFSADPLGTLVQAGATQGITKLFGNQIVKVNEFTKALTAKMQYKLEEWSDLPTVGDKDFFKKMLGDTFKLNRDRSYNVEVGKFDEGAVDFDGKTRKAITDVIPMFLGKILAAIKGQDSVEIYDYEKARFVSSHTEVRKLQKDLAKIDRGETYGGVPYELKNTELDSKVDKSTRAKIAKEIQDMAIQKGAHNLTPANLKLSTPELTAIWQEEMYGAMSTLQQTSFNDTFLNARLRRSEQIDSYSKKAKGTAAETAAILGGKDYGLRGETASTAEMTAKEKDKSLLDEIEAEKEDSEQNGFFARGKRALGDIFTGSVSKGTLAFKGGGPSGLLGMLLKGGLTGVNFFTKTISTVGSNFKDLILGKDFKGNKDEISFFDSIKHRFDNSILNPFKNALLGKNFEGDVTQTSLLSAIKVRFNDSITNPLKDLLLGKDFEGNRDETSLMMSLRHRIRTSILNPLRNSLLGEDYKSDRDGTGFLSALKYRFDVTLLNPLKRMILGKDSDKTAEGVTLLQSISDRFSRTVLNPFKSLIMGKNTDREVSDKTSLLDSIKFSFNESILTPLKHALLGKTDIEESRQSTLWNAIKTSFSTNILSPFKVALLGREEASEMSLLETIKLSFNDRLLTPLKKLLIGTENDDEAAGTSFLTAIKTGFNTNIMTPMNRFLFGEENQEKGFFNNLGETMSPFFNKLLFGKDKANEMGFLDNLKNESGKLWDTIWGGLNRSVFQPMKDSLSELFGPIFKDFRETLWAETKYLGSTIFGNIKDGFSVSAKGVFKTIFGDETIQIMRENIVTPLQELSKTLTDNMGKAFKFLMRLPVNFFRGITDTMKISRMEGGRGNYSEEETSRLQALRDSGSMFNFKDMGKQSEDGESKGGFFARFGAAFRNRRGGVLGDSAKDGLSPLATSKLGVSTSGSANIDAVGGTPGEIKTNTLLASIRDIVKSLKPKTGKGAKGVKTTFGRVEAATIATGDLSTRMNDKFDKFLKGADASTSVLEFAKNNLTLLDSRLEKIVTLLGGGKAVSDDIQRTKTSFLRNPFSWMSNKLKGAISSITDFGFKAVKGLFSIPFKMFNSALTMVANAGNFVLKIGAGILQLGTDIASSVFSGLAAIGNVALKLASSIMEGVGKVVTSTITATGKLVSTAIEASGNLISAVGIPLINAFGSTVKMSLDAITPLFGAAAKGLSKFATGLINITSTIASSILNLTSGVIGSAVNLISGKGINLGLKRDVRVVNFADMFLPSEVTPLKVYVVDGKIETYKKKETGLRSTIFTDKKEERSLIGDDGKPIEKKDGIFGALMGLLGAGLTAFIAKLISPFAGIKKAIIGALASGMGRLGGRGGRGLPPVLGGEFPSGGDTDKKKPAPKRGGRKGFFGKLGDKYKKTKTPNVNTATVNTVGSTAASTTTTAANTINASTKKNILSRTVDKLKTRNTVKAATATGAGKGFMAKTAMRAGKGLGMGSLAAVGGGMAADLMFDEGTVAHETASKAASYAGIGAMAGSFIPVIGMAVGGVIGAVTGAIVGGGPALVKWTENKFESSIRNVTKSLVELPTKISNWAETFPEKFANLIDAFPSKLSEWASKIPVMISDLFSPSAPRVDENGEMIEDKPSILGIMIKSIFSAVYQIGKLVPKVIFSLIESLTKAIHLSAVSAVSGVGKLIYSSIAGIGFTIGKTFELAVIKAKALAPSLIGGYNAKEEAAARAAVEAKYADKVAGVAETIQNVDANVDSYKAMVSGYSATKKFFGGQDGKGDLAEMRDLYAASVTGTNGDDAKARENFHRALNKKRKTSLEESNKQFSGLRDQDDYEKINETGVSEAKTPREELEANTLRQSYHRDVGAVGKGGYIAHKSDPGTHTQADVNEAIAAASKYSGIPLETLQSIAKIESGGRYWANNPNYRGLFQMGVNEFAQFSPNPQGDIYDPYLNSMAAANYMLYHSAQLKKRDIPVTGSSLYLAHQQGLGGYSQLFKAARDGTPVIQARKNNMLSNVPQDGKGPTVDPREFIARWSNVVTGGKLGDTFDPSKGANPTDGSKSGTDVAVSPEEESEVMAYLGNYFGSSYLDINKQLSSIPREETGGTSVYPTQAANDPVLPNYSPIVAANSSPADFSKIDPANTIDETSGSKGELERDAGTPSNLVELAQLEKVKTTETSQSVLDKFSDQYKANAETKKKPIGIMALPNQAPVVPKVPVKAPAKPLERIASGEISIDNTSDAMKAKNAANRTKAIRAMSEQKAMEAHPNFFGLSEEDKEKERAKFVTIATKEFDSFHGITTASPARDTKTQRMLDRQRARNDAMRKRGAQSAGVSVAPAPVQTATVTPISTPYVITPTPRVAVNTSSPSATSSSVITATNTATSPVVASNDSSMAEMLSELKNQTALLSGINTNTEKLDFFSGGSAASSTTETQAAPTKADINVLQQNTRDNEMANRMMDDGFPMNLRPRAGAIAVAKSSMTGRR